MGFSAAPRKVMYLNPTFFSMHLSLSALFDYFFFFVSLTLTNYNLHGIRYKLQQ